jgi:hypothetical protein
MHSSLVFDLALVVDSGQREETGRGGGNQIQFSQSFSDAATLAALQVLRWVLG